MTIPNKFQIALHYEMSQHLTAKGIAYESGQIERSNETVLTIGFDNAEIYIFMDGVEFTGAGRRSLERRSFKNNAELTAAAMDVLRALV
jgi:hypothetical protein